MDGREKYCFKCGGDHEIKNCNEAQRFDSEHLVKVATIKENIRKSKEEKKNGGANRGQNRVNAVAQNLAVAEQDLQGQVMGAQELLANIRERELAVAEAEKKLAEIAEQQSKKEVKEEGRTVYLDLNDIEDPHPVHLPFSKGL